MNFRLVLAASAIVLSPHLATAQVGVGTTTPAASAAIDITSTTKGLLPPRMTWAQIQAIASPTAGLTVYDITSNSLRVFNGQQWTLVSERGDAALADAPGFFTSIPSYGILSVQAVAVTPDKGTVLAVVVSSSYGIGGVNGIYPPNTTAVLKLDTNGAVVWMFPIATNITVYDIDADATGNVYIGGSFLGTVDFDPSPSANPTITSSGLADGFLAAYTFSGTFLWSKALGGPSTDAVFSVRMDGSSLLAGGVFEGMANLGGTNLISAGSADGWVGKYSAATGSSSWATKVGGSSYDAVRDVAPYSGATVVTGEFAGTATFGTTPFTSFGSTDGFVCVVNGFGTISNAYRLGGTGSDNPLSIVSTSAGDIYLAGRWSGTCNFSLTGGTFNVTATSTDGFLVRYLGSASFASAGLQRLTGAGNEDISSIELDASGNIFGTGTVSSEPATLDPYSRAAYGFQDCVTFKVSSGFSVEWLHRAGSGSTDNSAGIGVSADGKCVVSGFWTSPSGKYITFDGRLERGAAYISRYLE